jgi:tetratricopeptide (TPR) repeat protein
VAIKRFLPACLILALAAFPAARACSQVGPPANPAAVAQAETFLRAGRADDAKRVLEAAARSAPADSEIEFLRGLIAVEQRGYKAAIRLFRGILVREPGVVRVRLELARAFFLAKDYDNAERQFRFARAGRIPAAVAANIDRYLVEIRRERQFTYGLALAVAPDTNINAGPSQSDVYLYGLPFTLSSDARKQSGVGLALDGSGEWSPYIGSERLRIGAQAHTRLYRTGEFDDVTLGAYVGPRFLTEHWDISPLLSGFRRWYGGRLYNEGLGFGMQAAYYPGRRLGLSAAIGEQDVRYGPPQGQSGLAVNAAVGFTYTLSPSSYVAANMSASRQSARLPVFANTAVAFDASFYCDLPKGYSVSIQPSITRIGYDAAFPAFGVARRDAQWSVKLLLLNRRIDVLGFAPRVMYTHIHDNSNISLFSYDRDQFELGLTRAF